MYEGSVCVWDMDMVAMCAGRMSVFVFGFGWCDIHKTIAVACKPTHITDTSEAMHIEHEV